MARLQGIFSLIQNAKQSPKWRPKRTMSFAGTSSNRLSGNGKMLEEMGPAALRGRTVSMFSIHVNMFAHPQAASYPYEDKNLYKQDKENQLKPTTTSIPTYAPVG